jgi:hypothetical protein
METATQTTKRKYTKRQQPMRDNEIRAEPAREEIRPKKTRTRRSTTDMLYVDPALIPDGMDYQWVTSEILSQPAQQVRASYEANGWEPVPAERHPGLFMQRGATGEINVGGLVLMERPLELTMEAREEERVAARTAVRVQEQTFRTGNVSGVTLDTSHPSARKNSGLTREMIRGIPVPKD